MAGEQERCSEQCRLAGLSEPGAGGQTELLSMTPSREAGVTGVQQEVAGGV